MRPPASVLEDSTRTFRGDEGIADVLVRLADGFERSTYAGVECVLIETERLQEGEMITIRVRMWGAP